MKNKKPQIQWHPAFTAAMNLEMIENRDGLRFEREYNLNVKPLEIDMLITKKWPGMPVENEIGRIFRGHNILEYKDPQDSLNIDVFFKTEGYACLYKSYGKTADAIKADDITISLIRDIRPAGLFGYFKKHGYQITVPFGGIYYITGKIPFPVQIVVSSELKPERHVWLRSLSGKLKKQDLENLMGCVRRLDRKMDRELAEAVLEVAIRANIEKLKKVIGDERMSDELLEIIRPFIEPKILLMKQEMLDQGLKQGIERGIEQGIERGIEQGLKQGIGQGIKGAVDILRDMGHENEEIKKVIMKRYELTEKDADAYL